MDLFLDKSNNGFLLELLSHYIRLTASKKVNPHHLSATTLKLIVDGIVKLPYPPTLVTEEGLLITQAYPIAFYLVRAAFADLLLGEDKEEQAQVRHKNDLYI